MMIKNKNIRYLKFDIIPHTPWSLTCTYDSKNFAEERNNNLTFKKSRSQKTSGLGSPMTSQSMTTVSPSTASLDLGLVTNMGTFEYLKEISDIDWRAGTFLSWILLMGNRVTIHKTKADNSDMNLIFIFFENSCQVFQA